MGDVAKEAGLSLTTVSVALSGVPNSGIPASTHERVRQAADRLGYVPNFTAQSLRTKRSHTLGFITDRIATSPFAGEMIAGAQATAWRSGYVLLIVDTGELDELANSAARVLLARHVEGVIVASWYHRAVDVPVALRATGPSWPTVSRRSATTLPSSLTRSAVGTWPPAVSGTPSGPGGPDQSRPGCARRTEAARWLQAGVAGSRRPLHASIVMVNPLQRHLLREAYELTNQLLDLRPDVKLLFCYNDRAAMGTYDAVKARGLHVRRGRTHVGFDDATMIPDG